MQQWLRCNDVDPATVPLNSAVFVESADGEKWVIRHAVYVMTPSFSQAEHAVPLLNDPPMWWLAESPPASDS
jgi:hypothetical protein